MEKTLEEHLLSLKQIFREAVFEALFKGGYDSYAEYNSPIGKLEDYLRQTNDRLDTVATGISQLSYDISRLVALLEKDNEKKSNR